MDRESRIHGALTSALAPVSLEIIDDSHLHAGHAGARDGRGHFRVRIVAACFAGRSRVARHQQVYAAMGDLLKTDVHALGIEALTPDEADGA
ncbi:MAG: BolA family transcriptional regulator [Gammaproteobacteria bacterium]|nr:BolA family transcriptional regulator [Gammaproteobacteria bacterium]